jgi:hypothetical protein
MKINEVKSYFKNILYFFLYGRLYLYPFSYSKFVDLAIREVLKKDYVVSEESAYLIFTAKKENLELKIWSENKWYAFASNSEFRKNGILIFKEEDKRPSYEMLYKLKKLFKKYEKDKTNKIISEIRGI